MGAVKKENNILVFTISDRNAYVQEDITQALIEREKRSIFSSSKDSL
jgi:hypothetical protein